MHTYFLKSLKQSHHDDSPSLLANVAAFESTKDGQAFIVEGVDKEGCFCDAATHWQASLSGCGFLTAAWTTCVGLRPCRLTEMFPIDR